MTKAHGGEMGVGALEKIPDEEELFEKELSRDLKSDTYLEVHHTDIKAMRAFRRTFHLDRIDPENLSIYVVHPERNMAITRAFKKGDSIPNFTFLTEKRSERDMLKKKSGFENVVKGDPAHQHLAERADIAVVLDKDVLPREKFLKQIAPGGWILCRMNMANSLRSTGLYKLKGVIESGTTSVDTSVGEEFWEKMQVKSDAQFQEAGKNDAEGVLTYSEAKDTLDKLDKPALRELGIRDKENVLESYQKLIEKAREQNSIPDAEGNLTLVIKGEGTDVKITLKTHLPTMPGQHEDDIIIMKDIRASR